MTVILEATKLIILLDFLGWFYEKINGFLQVFVCYLHIGRTSKRNMTKKRLKIKHETDMFFVILWLDKKI